MLRQRDYAIRTNEKTNGGYFIRYARYVNDLGQRFSTFFPLSPYFYRDRINRSSRSHKDRSLIDFRKRYLYFLLLFILLFFFVNVSTIRVLRERKSVPYKTKKGSRNCQPPSETNWIFFERCGDRDARDLGLGRYRIVDRRLPSRDTICFPFDPSRSSRFDLCARVCPRAAPWLPNSIHAIDPFRFDRSDYVRTEYALRSSVDNRSVSNAAIDSRAASLSVITKHVHAAFSTCANIPYSFMAAPFEREPFRSNV